MARLRRAELETALELLGIACELEGPEPFPRELLAELRDVMRASYAVHSWIDRPARRRLDFSFAAVDPDAVDDPDPLGVYWDVVDTNPWLAHRSRTGDSSVVRMSDIISRRSYHEQPIYREYFAPDDCDHSAWVALPATPRTDRYLVLWRPGADRDFSSSQRDLLELLRPHLARMCEVAELRRRVAQLPALTSRVTDREREILDLVALGKANAQIASLLWVAPSTVKKHLENVYEKLGVANRAAAVAGIATSGRSPIA